MVDTFQLIQLIKILLVGKLVWLSVTPLFDQRGRVEMLFLHWLIRLCVVWWLSAGKLRMVDCWLLGAGNYGLCVVMVFFKKLFSALHWLCLADQLYLIYWLTLLRNRTYSLSWLDRLSVAGSAKCFSIINFWLLSVHRPTNRLFLMSVFNLFLYLLWLNRCRRLRTLLDFLAFIFNWFLHLLRLDYFLLLLKLLGSLEDGSSLRFWSSR